MNISGLVCPIPMLTLMALGGDHLAVAGGPISYPLKDEIPILLGPEAVTEQAPWPRNLRAPQYDEAYKEMEFYNFAGYEHAKQIRETGTPDTSDSAALRHLGSIAKLAEAEREPFPESDLWYCETIDVAA